MKQCPDCNMMLDDNVETCPACLYEFGAESVNAQPEVKYEAQPEVEEVQNIQQETQYEAQPEVEEVQNVQQETQYEAQPEVEEVQNVQQETQYEAQPEVKNSQETYGQFVCCKCGNNLASAVDICTCGGHAKNAIPAGCAKKEKKVGFFGWIFAVLLAPLTWIISYTRYKSKLKDPDADYRYDKNMSSISMMSTIVYVAFAAFYVLSQIVGKLLMK